jgi:hypothetical protein
MEVQGATGCLNPGGDILQYEIAGSRQTLIYEPLGGFQYLLSDSYTNEKGVFKAQQTGGVWILKTHNGDFTFSGEPLDVLLWNAPSPQEADAYVQGRRRVWSSSELWDLTLSYITKFGDFHAAWHPIIASLFVFQTHLKPILNSLFRLPVTGPFGAGKTAVLEALCACTHHGLMEATTSAAARARLNVLDISWFADELDKAYTDEQGDSLSLVLLRTGYRRGAKYVRWDSEGKRAEVIDLFHNLCYSLSSDIERGLKTRSLGEISITRSMDYRVPIINSMRETYGKQLVIEFFFWRLEFLHRHFAQDAAEAEGMPSLEDLVGLSIDEFRERLYSSITNGMSSPERTLLTHLFGRESELAFIVLRIENYLSLDLIDAIVNAVNSQRESDIEPDDPRFVWLLDKLSTISPVDELQGQLDTAGKGQVTIRMRDVTDELNKWCKDTGQRLPKGSVWKSWYRRLGIERGKNLKHGRDSETLVFDPSVRNAIRDLTITNPIRLDEIRHPTVNAVSVVNPKQPPEEGGETKVHDPATPEMPVLGSQDSQHSHSEETESIEPNPSGGYDTP